MRVRSESSCGRPVIPAGTCPPGEAAPRYYVRHVKTGRYLSVGGWRGETPLSGGAFNAAWSDVPGIAFGDWDRRVALGLAKVWIALTGDADVEIEEVPAYGEGGAPHG